MAPAYLIREAPHHRLVEGKHTGVGNAGGVALINHHPIREQRVINVAHNLRHSHTMPGKPRGVNRELQNAQPQSSGKAALLTMLGRRFTGTFIPSAAKCFRSSSRLRLFEYFFTISRTSWP